MNYARSIRIVRAARGISQKKLAELVEVNPSTISMLESGKRIPSMKLWLNLIKSLDSDATTMMLLGAKEEEVGDRFFSAAALTAVRDLTKEH